MRFRTGPLLAALAAVIALGAGVWLLAFAKDPPPRRGPGGDARERNPRDELPRESESEAAPAPVVELPSSIEARPYARAAPDEEAPAAQDASSAATVEGLVLLPDGSAAAGTDVAIFRDAPDQSSRSAVLSTASDAEGRFRFGVPPGGPDDRILVAQREGSRPAAMPLPVTGGARITGLVLRLRTTAGIHGIVRLDGKPVDGAGLDLDVAFGTPGWFECGAEMWWTGGAPEIKRLSGRTDAQGRFRFDGLSPIGYGLAVELPGVVTHPDAARMRIPVKAESPPATLDIDIEASALVLRVTDGAELVACAARLRSVATNASWSDEMGHEAPTIHVRPRTGYELQVCARGFETRSVAIPPLAAGETRVVDVVLDRRDDADLLISVAGEIDPGDELRVALVPDGEIWEERDELRERFRSGLVARRPARGRPWRLADVPYPAGRYRLVVAPADKSSWMLPASTTIDLPANGDAAAEVVGRPGGRMKVAIEDAAGTSRSGQWLVRDQRGGEVLRGRSLAESAGQAEAHVLLSGEFRFRVANLSRRASRSALLQTVVAGHETLVTGSDPTDSWRREMGLLEPGSYGLEVTEDGPIQTEPIPRLDSPKKTGPDARRDTRIEARVTTRETVRLP